MHNTLRAQRSTLIGSSSEVTAPLKGTRSLTDTPQFQPILSRFYALAGIEMFVPKGLVLRGLAVDFRLICLLIEMAITRL